MQQLEHKAKLNKDQHCMVLSRSLLVILQLQTKFCNRCSLHNLQAPVAGHTLTCNWAVKKLHDDIYSGSLAEIESKAPRAGRSSPLALGVLLIKQASSLEMLW